MAELKRGIEIERKYVIELPDTRVLEAMDGYTVSDIVQTYIESDSGITHRVRSRSFGGVTRYYETRKTRIDKMSVVEEEGELTLAEYEELLKKIKVGTRPIEKRRHTFDYKGQTFELDVYPEWTGTAIMETELPSREAAPDMPDFIRIIKEVTGIFEYSNASMSIHFPKELI